MDRPRVVSAAEWRAAREDLLVKEKELTGQRDALAAERRRLPMVRVEKDYAFEGPDGEASLHDLFDGRLQLVVYRFYFEPGVARWLCSRHSSPTRKPSTKYRKLADREAFKGEIKLICCTRVPALNGGSF